MRATWEFLDIELLFYKERSESATAFSILQKRIAWYMRMDVIFAINAPKLYKINDEKHFWKFLFCGAV